jgi:hypothetical protein
MRREGNQACGADNGAAGDPCSTCFGRGILGSILFELCADGCSQIDSKAVAQLDEVDRYVGSLVRDLIPGFDGMLLALVVVFPLKMFKKFRSLERDGLIDD